MNRRATVLLLLVTLALSACGKIAEEAVERGIESQTGGDVEIDADQGNFSVESSEGTFEQRVGQMPDNFPDSVPLPDIEVQSGMRMETEDGNGWNVSGLFAGDCEDFVAFYNSIGPEWSPLEGMEPPTCDNSSDGAFLNAIVESDQYLVTYGFISDGQSAPTISVQVIESTDGG